MRLLFRKLLGPPNGAEIFKRHAKLGVLSRESVDHVLHLAHRDGFRQPQSGQGFVEPRARPVSIYDDSRPYPDAGRRTFPRP